MAHAEDWILYEDNIGETLSLDEVSLSDGELYTVLTNSKKKGKKGTIVAMIKGIKSSDICEILDLIPKSKREMVKEVSVDMANNMEKIAYTSFPSASIVTDRFHVAQLISGAVQEMRIKHRWKAIEIENKNIKLEKEKGGKYVALTFKNGDTRKQLLARSRYLLFKPVNKWSESQRIRAEILFTEYDDLKNAYDLSMMFRNIYQTAKTKAQADDKLTQWIKKVNEYDFSSFITAGDSILYHKENILNYFMNKTTNAFAESFNAKIKNFRNIFTGVRDIPFFLFRLTRICA